MSETIFKALLGFLAGGFAVALVLLCGPAFVGNPDLPSAIAGGFVNPYASAYALDAITCWCVLAGWVLYEARSKQMRHGWIALVLGILPGVATGFAVYLLLRLRQERAAPTITR
jgi:hypothetical protein